VSRARRTQEFLGCTELPMATTSVERIFFEDMKTRRRLVPRNNLVVRCMFSSTFKTLKLNT
jgi:hypothetical protein